MSLAMYAAPFDNNSSISNNNDSDNIINKKKQTHNRTQKRYLKENFDSEKVNSVLQSIHNNSGIEEDNSLGDFNPPPKPESSGVDKTITTEQMHNMSNNKLNSALGLQPQPNFESSDNLDLNNFNVNYGDNKSVEDYYNKHIPNYNINKNPYNRQYYQNNSYLLPNDGNSNDVLIQKLNYMINLLEEKHDERTNNVTEEVILYSFLGVFIIFVVDSFARIGKYTR
jgi:hypothetical protein